MKSQLEIKAKSKINNSWVRGYYQENIDAKGLIKPYIGFIHGNDKFIELIDPRTISRYSGKDNIYENDIIEFTDDEDNIITSIVVFEQCMFCVIWEDNIRSIAFIDDIKVIGNFIDNPDIKITP